MHYNMLRNVNSTAKLLYSPRLPHFSDISLRTFGWSGGFPREDNVQPLKLRELLGYTIITLSIQLHISTRLALQPSMAGIKHPRSEDELAENSIPMSPFITMFQTFRSELDEHHDRRERIIKASRDITALSKKM